MVPALCLASRARAAGPEIFAQMGHTNTVHAIAFSPRGHRLASAGEDGVVIIWDVDAQRELLALKASAAGINAVAVSTDGALMAGRVYVASFWYSRNSRR
jgi:WD40 repeat protein